MNETEEKIIWEAEFNPRVKTYWLLTGFWILLITFIGIPLIPLWAIFGPYLTGRYLNCMRCALTDKSILLNKGILVRREKTVPLDKITDVALAQGPIMRSMELHSLAFETAGQSANAMATLSVCGVVDAREFRDVVLKQRDRLSGNTTERRMIQGDPSEGARMSEADGHQTLIEILNVLQRIEAKMGHNDSSNNG